MEQQKYTRQQFASKIKEKYPAYAEMDDNTLVDKITAKYPQYLDQIEGGKTNAVAEETATVAADQQSELDLQSESGLSEQQEIPEVPTWLEETLGKDTFGVDFASDMYRAVKTGWRQSSAAGEIADVFTGDQSDQALNNMREKMKYIQETPQSEEMQAWSRATEKYKQEGDSGFIAGLKAFMENPSIGPEVMLSSVTQLAGTALDGGPVSAMVAAGTATGAGVGALGGGIGAIPGAALGAQSSTMVAMEALTTFSELLQEQVEEQGGKFSNNDDLRKVLESDDAMSEIYRKAIGRGVAIGAIEALTGGIAGKIGAGAKGLIGLQKVPRLAGALAVEAAGGMAGETAGMLAAGQELAGEEIFLEGIAGAPTAIAQSSLQAAGLGDPQYRVNGKKVKAREGKAVINDMVNNASDEDFAGMRVKIKNDPKLAEEVQERRKKVIQNNKEAVKQKIQPEKATDLKGNIDFELKKAEAELKQIQETEGEVVAEAAQKRVDALKQQLKDVDNHISFQLDELNEDELLDLMNMDDDVSLFQSILNDPGSSEAAKKSARAELSRLKESQINKLNDTDSADLARPDGPRKQKNVDLSQKTQDAYERGGKNAWGEIAQHQMGTVKSIATSLWSRIPEDKKVGTYDDFVAGIISEPGGLRDMVASYKPELGVPLAAYLGDRKKGLRARANRIVKKFTKQDIQSGLDSKEAMSTFAEGIDIDAIDLGPEFLYQKLGLGRILGDLTNDVEIALTKTEGELSKLGEVTQKKRQSTAEKAFNSVFTNKYDKKIKEFIGKNTKNDDSFSKFIKNNFTTLRKIALSNIDFQKGSGISKTWNTYAPNLEDFLDYYEGKDITPDQPSSTKNDRKNKLVKAIEAQLANDARESYFREKPAERAEFNEQQQIAFQEAVDEITGANVLLGPDTEGDVEASITNINKLAEELGIKNFDRRDPEFISRMIVSLGKVADAGLLTEEDIDNLSMANFGAINERREDGNKYYKLKNGDFIIGVDTGKTDKSGKKIFKAPEADLMPSDGGLFYSVKDPALVDIKNRIKKAKRSEGIKLKAPEVNPDAAIKGSKTYLENQKKQEINNKAFSRFLSLMDEVAKIDPGLMLVMVHDGYRASKGIIKAVAPVKYISKNLEFGTPGSKYSETYKKNKENNYRDEHNPPASVIGSYIAKAALTKGGSRAIKPLIDKQFHRVVLSLKADEVLDKAGFGGVMPSSFRLILSNSLGRYFNEFTSKINGGIDPDSIIDIETGKSIREIYGIDSSGVAASLELTEQFKDKTPDKIQSAIEFQEANTPDPELTNNEKVEALTDLFNSVYGTKATRNKQEAIDYLVSIGFKEETAKNAVEQKGFRVPGLIYVNEQLAGVDTPMHEFTHEWAELVNRADPELFNAIYNKLTDHPRFEEAAKRMADSKIYSQYSPNSFEYKNEVMAHILGEEGKSLYEVFEGDAEAKSLIDKFFDYVKEALGFDPATKNFADLTVDEVIKLAVKDITEGNPAANFNKLKNVAEGKSWFAKSEAAASPSAKAKADPILKALNKLKLSYRENKNLAQAINDAYSEVEGIMDFLDFARLIAKNTKEITTGKTKQLLVAKADVIKANKIAEESAKKQAEAKVSEDYATELQNKFRRLIYQAKGEGAKASKWFIPPNAEDFKGLLYTFLPKGEAGVAAKKWMTEVLLKPYSDAIAALDTEILNKSKAWAAMSKGFDFNQKVDGSPYTLGDAIKVYNALKEGKDPGIAKKKHLDALIHAVESNSEILDLANEIADSFPIDLKSGWQNRSFAKEIYDSINDGARKRHLETFSANVDAIFNDTTLDLIADQFGVKYKQALVNTLKRMKSGRNRTANDANANAYMNWLNRAVGTTMFLNTRSAVLQLLSTLNFIGKPGNNLFQATAAFANRKQWNEDYKKLWDSDYLTNRRDGAKFDVLADEIANDPDNWISKILQKGFLPTRYADSFAIALGGASFYRNRINSLVKEGMSEADAEVQAMKDWRQAAEESQQSSDPSKISEIQASSIGKIIYAFANTPFQYARITKRKLQDLTSGRSAAEGSVQKDLGTIFYYSMAQALIFNALQSGLVALLMSDDEDDEELKQEKYASMLERSLTSFAKSTGNPGAVASTLYAMMKEGYLQQTGKKRPDANAFAVTATSISPPLNSKLRDIAGAYRAYNKIEDGDAFTPSLDNEALTMAGEVASVAGLPLDRVIRKARHLAAISNEEAELWQKIWMLAGWSEWELGVDKPNVGVKKPKIKKVKITKPKLNKPKLKKSPTKKLERGVAGRANNDGTIEIDPNLSPVEREKTIAHEEQHVKDMKAGKLDYDDNYVYWNDSKYERKNGKIKYKGKSYIEGHKDLPWEKKAYAAEPSTAEAKKRTKLYA